MSEIQQENQAAKNQQYALANVPLVQQMAAEYNFGNDLERFETTLIKTVFPSDKPVTNSQLLMFLGVAKAYKLNPFIREIYAFPSKGGIVPIVSVDGWISLVQRQANYNGHRFVYEWADGKVGGQLLAATCLLFRKDLANPIEHTEFMEECVRGTDVWQKWPRRMMTHRAFIQCARYAFGFSGIYDEDEGERILEGTLKPAQDGNYTAEIAMPQRVQSLPAPATIQTGTTSFQVTGTTYGGYGNTPKTVKGETIAFEPEKRAGANAAQAAKEAAEDILWIDKPYTITEPEAKPDPKPEAAQEPVRNPDSLQDLFDSGLVRRGVTDSIGRGRAQRLYAILNKHKIHTEQETKEEFLRPLGLEHLADMPLDIYEKVVAWAEGKMEDQG